MSRADVAVIGPEGQSHALVEQQARTSALALQDRVKAARTTADLAELTGKLKGLTAYYRSTNRATKEVLQELRLAELLIKRRRGEILESLPKARGTAGRVQPGMKGAAEAADWDLVDTAAPTREQLGLTKREAREAQKVAALPESVFAAVCAGDLPLAAAIAPPKTEEEPKRLTEIERLRAEVERLEAVVVEKEIEVEELRELWLEAKTQADALVHIKNNTAALHIVELQQRIQILEASRDEYMNKSAEAVRQVSYWERRARKLEKTTGNGHASIQQH